MGHTSLFILEPLVPRDPADSTIFVDIFVKNFSKISLQGTNMDFGAQNKYDRSGTLYRWIKYREFQRILWILRSLRPHPAHTPFEVRRRLDWSLILPYVNYGIIVFTGADSAS
jgi:hypothetical protein